MKWVIGKNQRIQNKLYQDLRFNGLMNMEIDGATFQLINPGNTTIENEIFWNGLEDGWEKNTIKLWSSLVLSSYTILDIGANSGVFSIISSALNPKANVFAFEPVKRTALLLQKNIEINQFNNITFCPFAVSDNNGKATFYDVDTPTQYSASLNAEMLKNVKNQISYEVDIVKLDDFGPLQGQTIDLIKLDVEMHEPEALKGMTEIIARDRPVMIIEILNEKIGLEIIEKLKGMNYSHFSILEDTNELLNFELGIPATGGNYLFIPIEKEILISGFRITF
ncbi:MAG: FkbM family methyltransferase [Bacteroidetes bacterium]|nr:FkbM family methyltransferase [Bacteroidota bacterium]